VALSYPRITDQDRRRLIERQTVLKQPREAESKSADWREPISNRPYIYPTIPKSEAPRNQSLDSSQNSQQREVSQQREPEQGGASQQRNLDRAPSIAPHMNLLLLVGGLGGITIALTIGFFVMRPERSSTIADAPAEAAAVQETAVETSYQSASSSSSLNPENAVQPSGTSNASTESAIPIEPPSRSMALKLKRSVSWVRSFLSLTRASG
jgi:FtsZ-interacting cell division protein ZipA